MSLSSFFHCVEGILVFVKDSVTTDKRGARKLVTYNKSSKEMISCADVFRRSSVKTIAKDVFPGCFTNIIYMKKSMYLEQEHGERSIT